MISGVPYLKTELFRIKYFIFLQVAIKSSIHDTFEYLRKTWQHRNWPVIA